jgi:group II intron reverse transcriptase/maturase
MPSFRDKLVQEVIRAILEAIYEPTFLESSHGYRPKRSCHTALCQIKKGMGTSWVIEGDIKGYYDNIDHEILLKLLSKRIDDGRFIELIRRFLKAGYMEFKKVHNSLSGTPQGGIISPILANIYLHELDSYMESLKTRYEKGERRESNPEYDVLYRKRRKKIREGKIKEAEEILREMRKIPSLDLMDENFVRVKYIRYADDCAPRTLTERMSDAA